MSSRFAYRRTTFRFFLIDEHREPLDPVAFVTVVPNWSEGEAITLGSGEQYRILSIETFLDEEALAAGFNGVCVVEPVSGARPCSPKLADDTKEVVQFRLHRHA